MSEGAMKKTVYILVTGAVQLHALSVRTLKCPSKRVITHYCPEKPHIHAAIYKKYSETKLLFPICVEILKKSHTPEAAGGKMDRVL